MLKVVVAVSDDLKVSEYSIECEVVFRLRRRNEG